MTRQAPVGSEHSSPSVLPGSGRRRACSSIWLGLALVLAECGGYADQIEMQNGDRYAGKVLTLSSNSVVLQSEVLGTVTLPREKIATIALGPTVSTNTS